MQKLKVLPHLLRMRIKTPLEGAQTTIYCAVSEEMEGVTGQYLTDCRVNRVTNPQANDDEAADKLWEMSKEMVGSPNTQTIIIVIIIMQK